MESNYAQASSVQTVEKKPTDTASLILGIVSIVFSASCFGVIPGVLAIVFGYKNRSVNTRAKAGMITGIIGTCLSVVLGLLISVIVAICVVSAVKERDNSYYDDCGYEDYYDDYNEPVTEYINNDLESTAESVMPEDLTEFEGEQVADVVINNTGYVPDYTTKVIGSAEVGYTIVPDNYYEFHESGGHAFTNVVQYSYGFSVVGLCSAPTSTIAYEFAKSLEEYSRSSADVDQSSIQVSTEEINGIYGYKKVVYYPADDMYLITFVFDGEDGLLHYISVEYPAYDTVQDLWETVMYNYHY